jgi:hypothetical protein
MLQFLGEALSSKTLLLNELAVAVVLGKVKALDKVASLLVQLAGGADNGAVWSERYNSDNAPDMLPWFQKTLDLVNAGQIETYTLKVQQLMDETIAGYEKYDKLLLGKLTGLLGGNPGESEAWQTTLQVLGRSQVTKLETLLCRVLLKPSKKGPQGRLLNYTTEFTQLLKKDWKPLVHPHLEELVSKEFARGGANAVEVID